MDGRALGKENGLAGTPQRLQRSSPALNPRRSAAAALQRSPRLSAIRQRRLAQHQYAGHPALELRSQGLTKQFVAAQRKMNLPP